MESKAKLLKMMGHELRLELLSILSTGEYKVGQLEDKTGKVQSTVSQHLSILRTAGIVKVRREGTRSYYSIANETAKEIINVLNKK